MVAWQISSDTNDFVFSHKYYTPHLFFFERGVTNLFIHKQADSTGNETGAKEAADSLDHLAHVIW